MNARVSLSGPLTRALCLLVCLLGAGHAPASPPRGSVAPPITLKDLNGQTVSTEKLAPRALVLIFGQISHEGVQQACADVLDSLSDPRLAGDVVVPILIVSQDAPPAQLKDEAVQGRYPAIILQDPKREAFGAYHVLVIPTIVVVDDKSKVVYSLPAYLQKSRTLLTESILTATGKESPEQFELSLDPKAPVETHESIRAERLVHLGHELTRHGLYEMAEARFTEATALVPGHTGAMLGLGDLMLRQDRLAEAEPLFRSVLAAHPDSQDAVLGMASVQLQHGGDDVVRAQESVQSLIDKDPQQPRARYLMGLIQERRGDTAAAAAAFKKAAELLMDR
jgi:hypothetical protein